MGHIPGGPITTHAIIRPPSRGEQSWGATRTSSARRKVRGESNSSVARRLVKGSTVDVKGSTVDVKGST
eukprot:6394199-Pyramimonas_sp.AAC.3